MKGSVRAEMKKLILHTLAVCTLAVCCLSAHVPAQTPTPPAAPTPSPVQPPPTVQSAAPTVKLEPARSIDDKLFAREQREIGGRVFRLSEYRGRVFVINIWATWCGPCWQEIPGFNRIYEDYKPRGVEFVGLTMNDPTNDFEKVEAAARELKMKYRRAWLDYETALALMGTRHVIPQTFVVGADGRILLHIRGYNPRVPEMVRSALWQALNPTAPAPTAAGTAAPQSAAPPAPTKPAPAAPSASVPERPAAPRP
jgi:thiol-disulfide isomerase/thioredoxin